MVIMQKMIAKWKQKCNSNKQLPTDFHRKPIPKGARDDVEDTHEGKTVKSSSFKEHGRADDYISRN